MGPDFKVKATLGWMGLVNLLGCCLSCITTRDYTSILNSIDLITDYCFRRVKLIISSAKVRLKLGPFNTYL